MVMEEEKDTTTEASEDMADTITEVSEDMDLEDGGIIIGVEDIGGGVKREAKVEKLAKVSVNISAKTVEALAKVPVAPPARMKETLLLNKSNLICY